MPSLHLHKLLVHKGFNFTVTHTCHLGFTCHIDVGLLICGFCFIGWVDMMIATIMLVCIFSYNSVALWVGVTTIIYYIILQRRTSDMHPFYVLN